MARPKSNPPIKPKTILVKPREVFKNELLERISIGEELHNRNINDTDQLSQLNRDAASWDDFNEELIKRSFNNKDSEYFYEYSKLNTMAGMADYLRGINTEHPSYKLKIAKEKIDNCVIWLKRLVDKLPLIEEDGSITPYLTKDRAFYNKCFIVHGHDEARKYEVARFIDNDLRKKAIILHEQPNKGRTIIEKFESYSAVDFAVALWTADDLGKEKKEDDLKERARQNVIFETGFFIGKVGRQNVIVLYENGVEIPSDYSGVIFIPFTGNWKDDLRKEVDAIYES
jgi:hypothetical protein